MRRRVLLVALGLVGASAIVIAINPQWHTRTGKRRAVSRLSFDEVDRKLKGGMTDAEVEDYSRELRGTRVQWEGEVLEVDSSHRVYLAARVYPANFEFEIPVEAAARIKPNQRVSFAGTIENVSVVVTFPPMPNTYVRF